MIAMKMPLQWEIICTSELFRDWLDFLDRPEAMVYLGGLAYQVPQDRLDRPVRTVRKDSEDSRARRDSKETRGPMVRLEQQVTFSAITYADIRVGMTVKRFSVVVLCVMCHRG